MEDVSRNDGRTVLFVSHALSMVSKLCNKGILLNQGRVINDGPISTVIEAYEENILGMHENNDLPEGYMYNKNDPVKGEYCITSVRILDETLKPRKFISTYDEVNIEIEFYSPAEIENGSLSFFFKTLNDITILRFATKPDQHVPFHFKKGMNKAVCRIAKLNLPHGSYQFTAGLAIPMREWLYRNDDMFVFKVHEKDIFNSGFSPALENAVSITDYSWRILD